jgi:hypothetical protein
MERQLDEFNALRQRVVVWCRIMRPDFGATSVYPASEHEEAGDQQVRDRP